LSRPQLSQAYPAYPGHPAMRLFLIPISTRRVFVYCQSNKLIKRASYLDKIIVKAAETWNQWERIDRGWRKSLTSYGHRILQRIPYEEWGLKSIPPLSAQRQAEESGKWKKIDVIFPGNAVNPAKVPGILRHLATERQDLHRRRMWWSILLAPLTAPIALIPL
jgi:Mitochondrial K+-H+ exchange-related